jgi:hypothetical protein
MYRHSTYLQTVKKRFCGIHDAYFWVGTVLVSVQVKANYLFLLLVASVSFVNGYRCLNATFNNNPVIS